MSGICYMLRKDPETAMVCLASRPQNIARLPDVVFQRRVIEPAFRLIGGHAPIEIIRDDALPKPILLPPKERVIYDDVAVKASEKRERTLIYVGSLPPEQRANSISCASSPRKRWVLFRWSSSACARRTWAATTTTRSKRRCLSDGRARSNCMINV